MRRCRPARQRPERITAAEWIIYQLGVSGETEAMSAAELAYEQITTLPETQAREVLDFIGYLKEKSERNGRV
jgi:hypothetical protein